MMNSKAIVEMVTKVFGDYADVYDFSWEKAISIVVNIDIPDSQLNLQDDEEDSSDVYIRVEKIINENTTPSTWNNRRCRLASDGIKIEICSVSEDD